MPETLTSPHNPRLKLVRKLATRRGRMREHAFVVEGEDLLAAGLDAGRMPRFVLVDASQWQRVQLPAGLESVLVEGQLLADVAELAHPPRVIAVFDLPGNEHQSRIEIDDRAVEIVAAVLPAHGAIVYLDGVRDPGNVGTVIRSADAFGVAGVALGAHTADPFSHKATRASMGAIFRVPCAHVAALPAGRCVIVLEARAGVALNDADLGADPVLCIGAEREGVGRQVRERADLVVTIPQRPGVDSLNAATAASIVLYEWQRQQLVAGDNPWE